MNKNLTTRICLYSGEEFIPKRSNQIFANDKYRIAHNNKKNNDKRKQLASINRPLLKSYDILNSILGEEPFRIIHKEFLRGAGFSFTVFTHFHMNKETKKPCYALYHIHYYKIDDFYYKILKND